MDDLETAWVAGFFDGEGHVRISAPTPGKPRYSLAVTEPAE